MRVDGRVPETSAGTPNGSVPRTTPSLTWSSNRPDTSMSSGNLEQPRQRGTRTRPRQSRTVPRWTAAHGPQRQGRGSRGRASSRSIDTASDDVVPSLGSAQSFTSTSASSIRLNSNQDATSSEPSVQEQSSRTQEVVSINVESGAPACFSGHIKPLSLSLRLPTAPQEVIAVAGTLCSALTYSYMSYGMAQKYDLYISEVDQRTLIKCGIDPGLGTHVMGLTEPIRVGESGRGLRQTAVIQLFVLDSHQKYITVGPSAVGRHNHATG